ncbi:unnamed protein product [Aphis gossypii]|uniref:Uncharacterized protein n=1 Tax=Aphis gossypii TaxID=80765 RepID=A0A9P0NLQ5_APHGO|nr:unnamed protein product [Aphis gossypii]
MPTTCMHRRKLYARLAELHSRAHTHTHTHAHTHWHARTHGRSLTRTLMTSVGSLVRSGYGLAPSLTRTRTRTHTPRLTRRRRTHFLCLRARQRRRRRLLLRLCGACDASTLARTRTDAQQRCNRWRRGGTRRRGPITVDRGARCRPVCSVLGCRRRRRALRSTATTTTTTTLTTTTTTTTTTYLLLLRVCVRVSSATAVRDGIGWGDVARVKGSEAETEQRARSGDQQTLRGWIIIIIIIITIIIISSYPGGGRSAAAAAAT